MTALRFAIPMLTNLSPRAQARGARRVMLASAGALALMTGSVTAPALAGVSEFAEVEPNNTKATANTVDFGPSISTIRGNTRGSSTTVAGVSSADYFLISTPAASRGIYRHRLQLTTTGTAGHTLTLRGVSQSFGPPASWGTNDLEVQAATTTTTPARYAQFYGFGKNEKVYTRVVGNSLTTGDYVVQLQTQTVTPVEITSVQAGTYNIRAVAAAQGAYDTDLVLLDSDFNFVSTRDDPDDKGIDATLALGGVYYVALSPYNLVARVFNPRDLNENAGPGFDFADLVANSSSLATSTTPMSLEIRQGTTVVATGVGLPYSGATTAFDVQFFRIAVAPNTSPVGTPVAVAKPIVQGEGYTLTVNVTPVASPASTGLSVVADMTSLGLSATEAFTGAGNTFTFSSTLGDVPPGTLTIPLTVSDAEGRSSTGSLKLIIAADLGTLSDGAGTSVSQTLSAGGVAWFRFEATSPASACRFVDLHTLGTTLTTINDTELALYDATGTLVARNDDLQGSVNDLSALSFGAGVPARTYAPWTTTLTGQTAGLLNGGVYYAAVVGFNSANAFGANFGVTSAATSAGSASLSALTGPSSAPPTVVPATYLKGQGLEGWARIVTCAGDSAIVTLDATLVGGPASVPMLLSSPGTFTATFAVSDSTADGVYNLPFIVELPAGTTVQTGTATLHVRSVTDLGNANIDNAAVPAGRTATAPGTPGGATWFRFDIASEATGTTFVDVTSLGSSFTPTSQDTVLALWRTDGTLVAANDDWAAPTVFVPGLSFGRTTPTRAYSATSPTSASLPGFDGRTGASLPAGTYYASVTRWATGFGVPAAGAGRFGHFTSAADAGTVRLIVGTNVPVPCNEPIIGTEPTGLTRFTGQPATFTVAASGTAPLSYQWRKNGVNIDGQTGPTLTIASATTAANGQYDCVVTNACGTDTSASVQLTVSPKCSPVDIANTDTDPTPDGQLDNGDFQAFFAAFFLPEGDAGRLVADVTDTDGDGGPADGLVDNGDFNYFFAQFFVGCPLPLAEPPQPAP